MIDIKTRTELDVIRDNCRLLARLFKEMDAWVKEGVSAAELDAEAENWILKHKAKPAFKGYKGFPATLCISVNDEVVHGLPTKKKVFAKGDLVGIDCGLLLNGFYADMAFTYAVDAVAEASDRLLGVTRDSLYAGIDQARTGGRLFDISHAVQSLVEEKGYSVVREFVGHGIGRALHEDPQVPNYGSRGKGIRLMEGMVLAIEPMVNGGGADVVVEEDGWTVRTKDGSVSAHFEHTIAITKNGPEILTEAVS